MRVLIVDDNVANRELLGAVLECQQHSVCEAKDGLEALTMMGQEQVDAIISDILMPKMDGYRLCLEVRKSEKLRNLPFIFYTSTYTSARDEKAAMDLDADQFLRKPASAQDIRQALQAALENRSRSQPAKPVSEVELVKECNERLVEKLEEKHRKLQEETLVLQTTQQRLQHVLSFSQAVIYSLKPNGEKFTLAWMSDNVHQLLGYVLEETSRPDWWWENVHAADREQVDAARLKLLSEGRAALEYRFRRKDGEYRWLRDEQRVVWSAEGRALEIVCTAMDITEFRDLQDLLRQSQKLEAIGRLAGGVAHDFNNLLAVIRGNLELALIEGGELGQETAQCLKEAQEAVDRAAGLTRQLLAFGRRQVMQPQMLNLNDLIAHVSKMLERIIGKHVELSCRYSAETPFVQADAGMLEQVIVNLVVNARDAMPNGGLVVITTETVRVDRAYVEAHPESFLGEFVAVTVSDTGTGIAPEHLPRIFEPFFSTKQVGKGTGLGLATVYGIVKQHHGWIEVASQVGTGSSFKVLLPAKACKPAPTAAHDQGNETPAGGCETILLVDDEEAVRSSICRLLQKFGYTVREAASGRAALLTWGDRLAEVDLLLTDIIMPDGVNGHQLAEALLAQRPDLKVIFMSGYAGPMRSEETGFLLRNNEQLLQKPCSFKELLRTVRQALDSVSAPPTLALGLPKSGAGEA